jgi:hypothetical protein
MAAVLHLTVSQIGRGSRQEFRPFALMDERPYVSLSLLNFTNEKRPGIGDCSPTSPFRR